MPDHDSAPDSSDAPRRSDEGTPETPETLGGDGRPERDAVSMISFVIPAMNEADSLDELYRRIVDQCATLGRRHEIILVDDGSTDSTWQVMTRLVEGDTGVRAIRFRRNFGKAAALSAGFELAGGEVVFTMDADLQDDPAEIPRFLAKLDSGVDVVSGWKKKRHDPWHKVLPSRVFNWLVSRLTGVRLHDHNCGFKAYRHGVVQEVELYGERHRFVPVLAAQQGWSVDEIEVLHHARQFGKSKYGVTRILKGFLDLMTIYFLTGFGKRPLHLVGAVGLTSFAVGGCGLLYLTAYRFLSWQLEDVQPIHLHQRATFYYCILAILVGGQFLVAGLLAELIVSQDPSRNRGFRISKRIGTPPDLGSAADGT